MIEKDASPLEDYVDFPSTRKNMKYTLRLSLMETLEHDLAGNPFTGLEMALADNLLDSTVDATVSAEGLAKLFQEAKLLSRGDSPHTVLETDEPIKQIAFELAFRDPDRFRHVLRNHVGVAPSAYRSIFRSA